MALVYFNKSDSKITHFNNVTQVSVNKMSHLGKVMVYRNGQLVPMLNDPEITDSNTLTFQFFKPESGLIY